MTVSVRTCSSDAELRRSLEIYNEVSPNRAATAEDVAAWKQDAALAANEERNAPMQHINSLLGYRLIPGRVRLRASIRKTSLR